MNLPDRPAIRHAYERAVVTLLNATEATEEEAEAFIDAMANLIFTTMQTYVTEEQSNATDHH
jgi:creatinine amidohydrolase/Fe(II)-dependent formamide hydrolase-like protein